MDTVNTVKQFKNSLEIRQYWRIHKREERAKRLGKIAALKDVFKMRRRFE